MEKNIYLLKLLWFILKYLIIILLVSAIFIVGFFVVKDTANVYIIATEGMEMRASTILNLETVSELDKYFAPNWAVYDSEVTTNKYDEFIIRDFDYEIKIRSIWVYPWDNIAYLKVTEVIYDIDGEYPKSDDEEQVITMPEWNNSIYNITLVRNQEDGSWHISELNRINAYIPEN